MGVKIWWNYKNKVQLTDIYNKISNLYVAFAFQQHLNSHADNFMDCTYGVCVYVYKYIHP